MKALVLAAIFLSILDHVFAQDILYKTDGEQMDVKVLEVSSTDIKYKLTSNIDGPTYVLPKIEVYMVEYSNGSKDVFARENKAKRDSLSLRDTESDRKSRSKNEKAYRREKINGVSGVVFGSVTAVIATPFLVSESIKYGNASKEDRAIWKPILPAFFTLLAVASLSAGINSLVNANILKTRLNNSATVLVIRPKMMNTAHYSGLCIEQGTGVGLGLTCSF